MYLCDGREKVPNYGKLPNGAQLGQYSIGASLWQLVQGAFLCSASHEYNRSHARTTWCCQPEKNHMIL